MIKNKHNLIFFSSSLGLGQIIQWIDINTDSHEPMITVFMEHTCKHWFPSLIPLGASGRRGDSFTCF